MHHRPSRGCDRLSTRETSRDPVAHAFLRYREKAGSQRTPHPVIGRMNLTRLALSTIALCAFSTTRPSRILAQGAATDARAKVVFRAFDLNESGWLSGRELVACDCRAYDADRNGEITWEEFRIGWARAPLFGAGEATRGGEPQRGTANAQPAPVAAPTTATSKFRPGDRVQINIAGAWHSATIVQVQNGRYRLSRDDLAYGVTTSDEWIPEERLRVLVDTPTPARAPTSALPASVPVGAYSCTTYGGGAHVGELRILGAATSSGVTPDGSGPQHKFSYDTASGTISWVNGLQIAGFTVERAEYRPETNGTPNINLHYRRQAGGNLNSMSCTRR